MSDAPVIDASEHLRLLGTAHIASSSVEAVRHHITAFQPDIVAVELCQSRLRYARERPKVGQRGSSQSHQGRQSTDGAFAVHAFC